MRISYLSGERVALRSPVLADKDQAAAWFDGVFPIDAGRAEAWLKEELKEFTYRKILLIAVRGDGEEVIGGVAVRSNRRHADIAIHMAPWLPDADDLRGEIVGLLVRWLRDESEHITTTAHFAEDWPATIAAAEAAGMIQMARIRQWYARPGGRADQLIYQALRPFWSEAEAGDA